MAGLSQTQRALIVGLECELLASVQAALVADNIEIVDNVRDWQSATAILCSYAVDLVVLRADANLAEVLAHLRQVWAGGMVVLGPDDDLTLLLTEQANAALVVPPFKLRQIRAALHAAPRLVTHNACELSTSAPAPTPVIHNIPSRPSVIERHVGSYTDLYAHVLATWRDLVCVLDTAGAILYANDAADQILGLRTEDVIGRNYRSFMEPGASVVAFQQAMVQCAAGKPIDLSTRWRHRDGSTVYLNVCVSACSEGDNYLLIGRDVTSLRQVELALRASEERYRLAGSAAHDILWDRDLLHHRLTWSEALYARTGHHPDKIETSDEWWFAQIHPEDRARVRASAQTAIEGASDRWSDEYRLRRADGATIHVLDRGLIVRNPQGQAMRMVGSMVDITELRAAQEALRESESRYRLLAQATNDVVWDWDVVTQEVMVSDNIFSVFNHTPENLPFDEGWWSSRIHPDDAARVTASLNATLSGVSEVWNAEYRFLRGDGAYATVLDRGYILRDANGAPRRMIGSMFDLTPYQTVQRQLEESQRRLEHAQKMEAVGRLAGGVAHDFNNLLTVIGSYGDLAFHKLAEGDPVRRYLGQIRKATGTASVLTRQLLALSRRQALQPKVINLNPLVEEVGAMVRSIIGPNIELRVHQDPELGQVEADDGQLHQVLLNLVVNAKDAMPDGGVLVLATRNFAVTTGHALQNPQLKVGNYVRLTVADSGIGMDQATLARIFEPFFTTKPSGVGTGLGLATVYGIVQQSHGSITVYSEVGRGTTFHVYLPRVDSVAAGVDLDDSAVNSPGGAETVLLVEDESPVRELVKLLLQEAGYRVLAAATPHEALTMEHEYTGPLELLLTDVVMPIMNGHDLAHEILRRRPSTRIIYMSGYTEDVVRYRNLCNVGVLLLEKPFAPNDLLRAVRMTLDQPESLPAVNGSLSPASLIL